LAARVELRKISNEEGKSVAADHSLQQRPGRDLAAGQIVLLAAQRMSPARIGQVVLPDPRAVRDRRWARRAGLRLPGRGHLPGRVRAAQPAATAGRQGLGAQGETKTDLRHLHPRPRRQSSPLRTRRRLRPAHRRGQRAQSTRRSDAATRPPSDSPSCSTTSPRTKATRCSPGPSATNVELAYTPHYASWLNRFEPQFKGLRYFCLAGTAHPDHETQTRVIRDYIDWRNQHRDNLKLRHLTRRELARKAAPT